METTPSQTAPMLKKKELLDAVVERSGVRMKFAKPTVEAMMAVLGEAIAEGRDLNLPPMGKIKQQRTKDAANVRVTVAKIRQSKRDGDAESNLGESGEENDSQGVAEAAE
jgi:DNA-binding protein HU-alpha